MRRSQSYEPCGSVLRGRSWVKDLLPVETNIVLFRLDGIPSDVFCRKLAEQGVRVSAPGPDAIRLVAHLGVSWEDVGRFEDAVRLADFPAGK